MGARQAPSGNRSRITCIYLPCFIINRARDICTIPYAPGRVTLNFNQSCKNHDVFLRMLLLYLFRQSEPCLTKLMIDVRSNGLILSQCLKQSLNHDVNFFKHKAWLISSGRWFLVYLACIIFSRKGNDHEEASYCCNTCVCSGPYRSGGWHFWSIYL